MLSTDRKVRNERAMPESKKKREAKNKISDRSMPFKFHVTILSFFPLSFPIFSFHLLLTSRSAAHTGPM